MAKKHLSPCGCKCVKCLHIWWIALEADPEDNCITDKELWSTRCPECDSDKVSVVNGILDIKEAIQHYAARERDENH